jgi:hypothetical protein
MPRDPVEFTRDLGPNRTQRVFNRTKREAETIKPDHCVESGVNQPAIVILPQIIGDARWRFDYIHYSYDGGQLAGTFLTVSDGFTTYRIDITHTGAAWLPFDTTRWARGAGVTIQLSAGGAGVTGNLNVLGARVEYVDGDTIP